ncbi:hypothetical protein HHO41_21215 [Bacillus sp. DNRA2]|uniref:hypothetical protein n=1 Tax=Bacillus sp. DNRA2 TaxID=2723053 RepID=UPI00145EBDDC|nr:hypothetical protein [Bacillus sp. DNRA2]NMD72751.1 hypothetical protein [Bacillus sp. DNRA2]
MRSKIKVWSIVLLGLSCCICVILIFFNKSSQNSDVLLEIPKKIEWGMSSKELKNEVGIPHKIITGEQKVTALERKDDDLQADGDGILEKMPQKYFDAIQLRKNTKYINTNRYDVCYEYKIKGFSYIRFYFYKGELVDFKVGTMTMNEKEYTYTKNRIEKRYGKFD